jgi:hypothetical protein
LAQASFSTPRQSRVPAKAGNHSRSSSVGSLADAANVLHHREAERIWVQAAETGLVEARLADDLGVVVQDLEHRAVVDAALFVKLAHDLVVDECRAALVHDLCLLLGIVVLPSERTIRSTSRCQGSRMGLKCSTKKRRFSSGRCIARFRAFSSSSPGSRDAAGSASHR